MRPRSPLRIARSAALAACMAATLAACSSPAKRTASPGVSTAEWSTTVDRTIPDAARAAKVKALGQQLAELQRSMESEFAELDQRAVALNARYDTTPEEARAFVREFADRRRVAFARYRDLVLAMRAEVSAAEWKKLSK